MGNINFKERRLFALFSSTFVSLLTVMLLTKHVAKGDIFTSLSKWETIVRVEENFVGLLEEYIKQKSEKDESNKGLIKFFKRVNDQSKEAVKEAEQFVSHPVNGFLVIKRFTSDWLEVEDILRNQNNNGIALELANRINLHKPLFPSYEDFKGAIEGLFRLQDTYNLTAKQFINGSLSERYPNTTLNTEDCFQIALRAYHEQDFSRAKEWMKESLEIFNPNIYSSYLNSQILQEYIAWCEYETGNVAEALNITKQIFLEESKEHYEDFSKSSARQIEHPNHISAKNNIIFFENALNNKEHKTSSYREKRTKSYMETYKRLCKGDVKKTPKELAKLKCYYDTKSSPVLFIKPAKIEVLNLQPRIVKYKNFITDEEIETLKKLANPKLERATINNLATGQLEFAKYRISESAWIADEESETVERMSEGIKSLTGLETEWPASEEWQIANYGIGGHYEPHFDHATNDKASILAQNNGNRLATFLIYMTNVESGGYTVFLNAEAVVKPTKGDAVFWYNLRRSGAGDSTTRHAACPVIVGSKWVSNKWIHAFGQEFNRKCGLTYEGLPGEQVLYKRNPNY